MSHIRQLVAVYTNSDSQYKCIKSTNGYYVVKTVNGRLRYNVKVFKDEYTMNLYIQEELSM